ncbi:uncharacterized protein LOC118644856 [Monomorium pharaonis]|uniref:uncharacterized protein LOC118644856 n=1 Tax=Monomorium pharaonis TaxID=307658 RepID=UPI0017467431|nr:uncharacterized protein LOC118644856 [Monomorium pharaonis]
MQEIMSNALVSNYSFYGAHKKQAFEKLKLYDVISSVVRCRFTNSLVTNKDISDPIKSWLRHAPARLSRKQKKAITNVMHDSMIVNDEINELSQVDNTVAKKSNVIDEEHENISNNDDAEI